MQKAHEMLSGIFRMRRITEQKVREREGERRICPYSIHSFSLCLYAICANDDGKCRCENFNSSVKGEGENGN